MSSLCSIQQVRQDPAHHLIVSELKRSPRVPKLAAQRHQVRRPVKI